MNFINDLNINDFINSKITYRHQFSHKVKYDKVTWHANTSFDNLKSESSFSSIGLPVY